MISPTIPEPLPRPGPTRPKLLCAVLLALVASLPGHAALRLGEPFSDHMVLPHDVPVTVWGSGAPGGDTVRVSIAGQTRSARSDWQGRWLVQLAPIQSGGPFQMIVEVGGAGPLIPSSAANETGFVELNDVLVGELLPLSIPPPATPAEHTRSGANPHPYAFVRVYRTGPHLQRSAWAAVFADVIPAGAESAFTFGAKRYRTTGIPVGVLETTVLPRCPPSTSCSSH